MPDTNHYQNLARTRLTMQVCGATVSPDDCRTAVAKLESQLEPPTILHEITPDDATGMSSLLQPATSPVFQTLPTALFSHTAKLKGGYLPSEWIHSYLQWAVRLQRWKQFETCRLILEQQSQTAELPATDGVVAGLLLYLHSPEPNSALRRRLFALALTHPVGAYLVAEGHHAPDERAAIIEAMQADSELLYRVSHQRSFHDLVLHALKNKFSLWAGLALARQETSTEDLSAWLQKLALNACDEPIAAVAALILQPDAPELQKNLWLACLQSRFGSRHAFEAVWRTRHTWRTEEWMNLKDTLRQTATADRAAVWFNWNLVEAEWVLADYIQNPIDPLWSAEFLYRRHEARLPVDDRPLRHQLVERLIANHGDHLATFTLDFLNQLQDGGIE